VIGVWIVLLLELIKITCVGSFDTFNTSHSLVLRHHQQ
jgi:hypothetical protein